MTQTVDMRSHNFAGNLIIIVFSFSMLILVTLYTANTGTVAPCRHCLCRSMAPTGRASSALPLPAGYPRLPPLPASHSRWL